VKRSKFPQIQLTIWSPVPAIKHKKRELSSCLAHDILEELLLHYVWVNQGSRRTGAQYMFASFHFDLKRSA